MIAIWMKERDNHPSTWKNEMYASSTTQGGNIYSAVKAKDCVLFSLFLLQKYLIFKHWFFQFSLLQTWKGKKEVQSMGAKLSLGALVGRWCVVKMFDPLWSVHFKKHFWMVVRGHTHVSVSYCWGEHLAEDRWKHLPAWYYNRSTLVIHV